jgi:hypothetical protein
MAKKVKKDARVVVTYDGSGLTHADHPATYAIKEDGTYVIGPNKKRVIKTPWRRDYLPIETYQLHGLAFPKGVPVPVSSEETAQKCRNLRCFKVEDAIAVAVAPAPVEPTLNVALEDMTKAKLLELAAKDGLSVPNGATKAQILEIVSARAS